MSDQPTSSPEPTEPQVDAAAPDAPPAPVDSVPSIEQSLRAAELKAAEHYDAWLRAKAETENVRRRAAEDAIKERKFAAEKFAAAMLPVKDSLEAALGSENASLETLKSGVELTLKQLEQAFQSASLVEVMPQGERFDPNKHQAISIVESDAEPNTVVQVLQKGYLLHERVIRPAMVIVAKAKAQGAA